MAKTYLGVENFSKRVRRVYGGLNGSARKMSKGYIGDENGIARQIYSAGELLYHTTLSENDGNSNMESAAGTNESYAIFKIGYYDSMCAYNTSLTKKTPLDSYIGRNVGCVQIGDYVVFGGGVVYPGDDIQVSRTSTVIAYNKSLSRRTVTSLSPARGVLATARVGNYALFAGGSTATGKLSVVEAYDESLTKHSVADLNRPTDALAGTTVGDYAIFAGGQDGYMSQTNTCTAYNSSLTKVNIPELSVARHTLGATTVGNYALFGGGAYTDSSSTFVPLDTVDVYSETLTQIRTLSLSVARHSLAATTIGDYAIFAGGEGYYSKDGLALYSTVDVFDGSLIRTQSTDLSSPTDVSAGTTIGDYALIGVHSKKIDVYKVL